MASERVGSSSLKLTQVLSIVGSILAVVGILSCLAMLLLQWQLGASPAILTQLAAICIPFSFALLFLVLVLMIFRRRSS